MSLPKLFQIIKQEFSWYVIKIVLDLEVVELSELCAFKVMEISRRRCNESCNVMERPQQRTKRSKVNYSILKKPSLNQVY